MLKKLLIVLGFALVFCKTTERCERENPMVTTPLGRIQGTLMTSRLGRTIYAFRGIRYSKPPVNELRFKPPEPVERWDGVYDATEDGPLCPQDTMELTSEDCLIVNVYSTKLPRGSNNPKRPVIVYIHAGGFYSVGSTSGWAGPNYFTDQDIVLVTFNYRLATLGFLSTGDKEAPGNNGMKDQVLLLKWVQQNIKGFGGDPDCVTLMGYSVGGWSVLLHIISPMSQGLFHRGVEMSESPVSGMPVPHNQLEIAKKQARLVGCPDDTAANIINCLKNVPFKELGESRHKFAEFGSDPLIIWSTVIEEDFGQERFLPAHPVELIKNGKFNKIPLIAGITADEFGYKAFNVVDDETLTTRIYNDYETIFPIAFLYERDTNRSKQISKELKRFYFHDQPVVKSQLTPLAHLYADSSVGFGVNRAVKLMAQYSSAPVYYYRFSYQGRYSHFYLPGSNNTKPYGVVHHDDLIYLFYIGNIFPLFNATAPREVEMVEKLTTIYGNFARTGKPIPTPNQKLDNISWEPFTLKDQKYMDIGKKLVMHQRLYEERYREWENLFPLDHY